jgi:hypothetical protein
MLTIFDSKDLKDRLEDIQYRLNEIEYDLGFDVKQETWDHIVEGKKDLELAIDSM